ncbi:MAG: polyprenyl synthetase family protein [Rikenellaceae bacterium]|nr:polyprenyl synthetase family protein [Rikenellaceae bacterium]
MTSMMSQIDEIKGPIKDNIEEFERYYGRMLSSPIPHIRRMVDFIIAGGGKHMRPIFLLLSAALHGSITEETYISASLIEITHTASLVHDDVIDEAYRRRSRWSVNALWRSHQAVLIGDFMLARGIRVATERGLYHLVETMSSVMESMSAGELLQSDMSQRLSVSRDDYFEVVRSKTALLLASAAEAGAVSVGASPDHCARMKRLGELIGTAFQIRDDIIDYSAPDIIGKPSCGDIRERKMTLPLIEALLSVSKGDRDHILSHLMRADSDTASLDKVKSFVIERGGLDKAAAVMRSLADEACALLACYDDTPVKRSLELFVDYAVTRDK